MKIVISFACLVLAASSFAANYPVDEAIGELRAKADYLELMKKTLETEKCSVQVGTNRVALTAGALRSQGLVMAIAKTNPGNYYAFDQAPKPQLLEQVIAMTFRQRGALIISARLLAKPGDATYTGLGVVVNKPKHDSGIDIYEKTGVAIRLPEGKAVSKSVAMPDGTNVTLSCN